MHPLPDGALILAATPIGSSDDASQTLRDALASADVIAAEDTRRFVLLTKRLGIAPSARVVSYFEGNEATRTGELVDAVAAGADGGSQGIPRQNYSMLYQANMGADIRPHVLCHVQREHS